VLRLTAEGAPPPPGVAAASSGAAVRLRVRFVAPCLSFAPPQVSKLRLQPGEERTLRRELKEMEARRGAVEQCGLVGPCEERVRTGPCTAVQAMMRQEGCWAQRPPGGRCVRVFDAMYVGPYKRVRIAQGLVRAVTVVCCAVWRAGTAGPVRRGGRRRRDGCAPHHPGEWVVNEGTGTVYVHTLASARPKREEAGSPEPPESMPEPAQAKGYAKV
jgi:hypothetical protein